MISWYCLTIHTLQKIEQRHLGIMLERTYCQGGSHVLVVMGGDSCYKGWSSNPSAVYWMDIFSHLSVVKIVIFV